MEKPSFYTLAVKMLRANKLTFQDLANRVGLSKRGLLWKLKNQDYPKDYSIKELEEFNMLYLNYTLHND